MNQTVIWSMVSFALGVVVSTVTNIAVFKSSIAVLTVRLEAIQNELRRIEKDVEKTNKYVADIMMRVGTHKRWSDERDMDITG